MAPVLPHEDPPARHPELDPTEELQLEGPHLLPLHRACERADRKRPSTSVNLTQLQDALASLQTLVAQTSQPNTRLPWRALERITSDMLDMSRVLAEEGAHATLVELAANAKVLHERVTTRHAEFTRLTPWTVAPLLDLGHDDEPLQDHEAIEPVAGLVDRTVALGRLPAHCAALRDRITASDDATGIGAAANELLLRVERQEGGWKLRL